MKIYSLKQKIFYITIIILMSIYSYKSIFYFNTYMQNNKRLHKEHDQLSNQKEKMTTEMQTLKVKIRGLKEDTLDKDILRSQAKLILNYIDQNELVIFD